MMHSMAEAGRSRQAATVLEQSMRRELKLLDIRPRHTFSPGIYAREITIPAGTLVIGMIHKYPQMNILSQGVLTILMEDRVRVIQSPYTVVSPAGTKRAAYAYTQCVWTTILATEETDIAKIESHFVCDTDEAFLEHCRYRLSHT